MKKTNTKDGSITYYNNHYDETYHSTSGAIEESFEKFAKPANVKNNMNVLDICFGLGYNSLAALSLGHVHITALENDKQILNKIQTNQLSNEEIHIEHNGKQIPFKDLKKTYEIIKQAAQKKTSDKNEIEILLGDARETIRQLILKYDVVFLDPFSPKKCPELWTKEFFKDIHSVMKQNGILTTYSCARSVRENLTEAGFNVYDGPCIGRRSPSTIAYKKTTKQTKNIQFLLHKY